MSWMKRGNSRNDLLTWAKTEYGKDWYFAYNFMMKNNGRGPNLTEINGPKYIRKEVA
jgi:hypothetical protein